MGAVLSRGHPLEGHILEGLPKVRLVDLVEDSTDDQLEDRLKDRLKECHRHQCRSLLFMDAIPCSSTFFNLKYLYKSLQE